MLEQLYFAPRAIDEAVELLSLYGAEAKILAGGTDLIIALKDGIVSCKYLIDIKKIPEMKDISYSEEEGLSIGAAVSLNEIINSALICDNYEVLRMSAKTLANSLLRNRATMMGNICNASPAGDMLTSALVIGGAVEAKSVEGTRIIPLKEFFLGVKKTALKPNEIATRLIFPKKNGVGSFMRRSRIKGHDLAQIGVAGFINEEGLKIALGSVAPVPVLIEEATVTREVLLDEGIRLAVIDRVMNSINPIGDQRASKEYRLAMAQYLTSKIIENLTREV